MPGIGAGRIERLNCVLTPPAEPNQLSGAEPIGVDMDERRKPAGAATEHQRKGPSQPPSRRALPPFEALRTFDAVARLGGVRKAAKWLERDHAVLSRHLRSLEQWCGAPLIERGPSGVTLTAEGKRYHAIISGALDEIAHASLDLLNEGVHHRLQIWSTPGFALHCLSAKLGEFQRKCPEVEIDVRPTMASPDFAAHEANFDIRYWADYDWPEDTPQYLVYEEFASSPIIVVASPAYLESRPQIEKPEDLLADHQLLHEATYDTWRAWFSAHGMTDLSEVKGPKLWQGHLTMDAARHGRGLALSNPVVAGRELKNGSLVRVGADNPNFPEQMGRYVVIGRRDRWDESALRRFRVWLSQVVDGLSA